MLLKNSGRIDQATELSSRALVILERTVAPDHPNLLACRANYAALCAAER